MQLNAEDTNHNNRASGDVRAELQAAEREVARGIDPGARAMFVAIAVQAMPFLVLTVEGAFRAGDRDLDEAAATLGASRLTVFRRVTLPLVGPSVLAGAVLCWARALGEFGATITFAGNFPGRTQTMPLAVYLALQSNPDAALALSLVLLLVSVLVLVGLRTRWWGAGAAS